MKYRVIHAETGEEIIEPTEISWEELESQLVLGLRIGQMLSDDPESLREKFRNYKIEEVEG